MTNTEQSEKWHFPRVGRRITKTTIAVFLCLMVYYIRGYFGQNMPTESAITAIICMQPFVRDTRDFAVNRFVGTLIGAFWGLLFLLMMLVFPQLGNAVLLLYALMALGVLVTLYSTVLLRMPDTASLAAIIFLCVVIAFPDIEHPVRQAINRFLDVFIGIVIAIGVNVFRLPRDKQRDRVFFVRTKDLVPDRFSRIPAAAYFRLNYLFNDGAKICLMSEHAPAFFLGQMTAMKLSVPLIVMDGAAIYDANTNTYLQTENIAPEDSERLTERLNTLGISHFVYTVHNNKTCIFHRGDMREEEKKIYDRMKRSLYRDYLEGEIYAPEEIVYFKIIDEDHKIPEIEYALRKSLPKGKMRAVHRLQAGSDGIGALYIYAHTATMEQAEKRLMQIMHEEDESLVPVEIRQKTPYRTEQDAMQLLYSLGNSYEPIRLFRRNRKAAGSR